MSNLLTVQDPDESAVEQATESRALLQAWADKHLPAVEAAVIQPLSDERVKELRTEGADELLNAWGNSAALRSSTPTSEFGKLLCQLVFSLRQVGNRYDKNDVPRELSYAVEGAAKEFQKQFFQAGMKWNLHAEFLAAASLQFPYYTSGYQDQALTKLLGGVNGDSIAPANNLVDDIEGTYRPSGHDRKTAERFSSLAGWIASAADPGAYRDYQRNPGEYVLYFTRLHRVGVRIHYMEQDGPWVAGFLNVDDACRLRFRRVRLGAFLTEEGLSDAAVRTHVERAKQQNAQAEFTAYPCDTLWEDAYTSGPNSCMSDRAGEYHTWDDIHPTAAYSSAYYGSGDNSLVLLVSKQDGKITGRGILNLQSGCIVRWYGDNVAERALKRSGVDTYDRTALNGRWLAHISNGNRFIHPYVDGDYGYGEIDGNRIIIHGDGLHSLQETSGSSYAGTAYYCEDTEREHGAEECTHQPITETYISDTCDSWRCPLIDEWVSEYRRTEIMLHGVWAAISEYAWYRINEFCTNENGGRSKPSTNYSIDDGDARERFLCEHGIDDPFDGQDDESDEESDEEAA